MKLSLEITDDQIEAFCALQNRIDGEADEDFICRRILEPFLNAEKEYAINKAKEEIIQGVETDIQSRDQASISISQ